MVQKLTGVGEKVFAVGRKHSEEATFIFRGTNNGGFTGDSNVFCRLHESCSEPAYLVDQTKWKRLLAGPDLSCGEGLDLLVGRVAACGNVMDELPVHIIDERLKVGLLLRGDVVGRVSGVFEFAGVDHDRF